MRLKLPPSTQNWLSLIGATIAVVFLFMIVFFFTITTFFTSLAKGNYFGIITYMVLPGLMIFGLILIPIGMLLKRREMVKTGIRPLGWPQIDLNDAKYRNAFFIFIIGSTILLFLTAIGSYKAFHITESVEFCGTLCHTVMQPEHTAYANSAHAKVACVECHVGSGVGWYTKSKLSGLRQVFAVLTDSYEKPIPTPIANLRPARETCEECHWPGKFYPNTIRHERHFLPNEENSEWDIHLRMKIGGTLAANSFENGVHWHINPDVKIEYFSNDNINEEINWVKYTNLKDSTEIIYTDGDNPMDEDPANKDKIVEMTCIGCHNRPSHNYLPPFDFIDHAIAKGEISKDLPDIKTIALDIFDNEFTSMDSAREIIKKTLDTYYEEEYPEIFKSQKARIDQSAEGIFAAASNNIFPEMKVKWSAYPNNIGHLNFPGCFRCHNDEMASEDEAHVISKDCNICHSIMAQGDPTELLTGQYGNELEFVHPGDIEESDWRESLCSDCHDGLNPQ